MKTNSTEQNIAEQNIAEQNIAEQNIAEQNIDSSTFGTHFPVTEIDSPAPKINSSESETESEIIELNFLNSGKTEEMNEYFNLLKDRFKDVIFQLNPVAVFWSLGAVCDNPSRLTQYEIDRLNIKIQEDWDNNVYYKDVKELIEAERAGLLVYARRVLTHLEQKQNCENFNFDEVFKELCKEAYEGIKLSYTYEKLVSFKHHLSRILMEFNEDWLQIGEALTELVENIKENEKLSPDIKEFEDQICVPNVSSEQICVIRNKEGFVLGIEMKEKEEGVYAISTEELRKLRKKEDDKDKICTGDWVGKVEDTWCPIDPVEELLEEYSIPIPPELESRLEPENHFDKSPIPVSKLNSKNPSVNSFSIPSVQAAISVSAMGAAIRASIQASIKDPEKFKNIIRASNNFTKSQSDLSSVLRPDNKKANPEQPERNLLGKSADFTINSFNKTRNPLTISHPVFTGFRQFLEHKPNPSPINNESNQQILTKNSVVYEEDENNPRDSGGSPDFKKDNQLLHGNNPERHLENRHTSKNDQYNEENADKYKVIKSLNFNDPRSNYESEVKEGTDDCTGHDYKLEEFPNIVAHTFDGGLVGGGTPNLESCNGTPYKDSYKDSPQQKFSFGLPQLGLPQFGLNLQKNIAAYRYSNFPSVEKPVPEDSYRSPVKSEIDSFTVSENNSENKNAFNPEREKEGGDSLSPKNTEQLESKKELGQSEKVDELKENGNPDGDNPNSRRNSLLPTNTEQVESQQESDQRGNVDERKEEGNPDGDNPKSRRNSLSPTNKEQVESKEESGQREKVDEHKEEGNPDGDNPNSRKNSLLPTNKEQVESKEESGQREKVDEHKEEGNPDGDNPNSRRNSLSPKNTEQVESKEESSQREKVDEHKEEGNPDGDNPNSRRNSLSPKNKEQVESKEESGQSEKVDEHKEEGNPDGDNPNSRRNSLSPTNKEQVESKEESSQREKVDELKEEGNPDRDNPNSRKNSLLPTNTEQVESKEESGQSEKVDELKNKFINNNNFAAPTTTVNINNTINTEIKVLSNNENSDQNSDNTSPLPHKPNSESSNNKNSFWTRKKILGTLITLIGVGGSYFLYRHLSSQNLDLAPVEDLQGAALPGTSLNQAPLNSMTSANSDMAAPNVNIVDDITSSLLMKLGGVGAGIAATTYVFLKSLCKGRAKNKTQVHGLETVDVPKEVAPNEVLLNEETIVLPNQSELPGVTVYTSVVEEPVSTIQDTKITGNIPVTPVKTPGIQTPIKKPIEVQTTTEENTTETNAHVDLFTLLLEASQEQEVTKPVTQPSSSVNPKINEVGIKKEETKFYQALANIKRVVEVYSRAAVTNAKMIMDMCLIALKETLKAINVTFKHYKENFLNMIKATFFSRRPEIAKQETTKLGVMPVQAP